MASLTQETQELRTPQLSPVNLVNEAPSSLGLSELAYRYGRSDGRRGGKTAEEEAAEREATTAGISSVIGGPIETNQYEFDRLEEEFGSQELANLGFSIQKDSEGNATRAELAHKQGTSSNYASLRAFATMKSEIARNPYYAKEIYAAYEGAGGRTARALSQVVEADEVEVAKTFRDAQLQLIKDTSAHYSVDPTTMDPNDFSKLVSLRSSVVKAEDQITRIKQQVALAADQDGVTQVETAEMNNYRIAETNAIWRRHSGQAIADAMTDMAGKYAKIKGQFTPVQQEEWLSTTKEAIATRIATTFEQPVSEVYAMVNAVAGDFLDLQNDKVYDPERYGRQEKTATSKSNYMKSLNDFLKHEFMGSLIQSNQDVLKLWTMLPFMSGVDPLLIQDALSKKVINLDVLNSALNTMTGSPTDHSARPSVLGGMGEAVQRLDREGPLLSPTGEVIIDADQAIVNVANSLAYPSTQSPEFASNVMKFFSDAGQTERFQKAIKSANPNAYNGIVYNLQASFDTMISSMDEALSKYSITDPRARATYGSDTSIASVIRGGAPPTAATLDATRFLNYRVDEQGNVEFYPIEDVAEFPEAQRAASAANKMFATDFSNAVRAYSHTIYGTQEEYQAAAAVMLRTGGFKGVDQRGRSVDPIIDLAEKRKEDATIARSIERQTLELMENPQIKASGRTLEEVRALVEEEYNKPR